MEFQSAIEALKAKRDQLDAVIDQLTGLQTIGGVDVAKRRIKTATPRRKWSPEARAAAAKRMRAYWKAKAK